jgi:hypothetical protein
MRRIDDLAKGTYELEVVREERTQSASSSLNPASAWPSGGVSRRILRVVGTSEEVEDARWESQASPGTRFEVRVNGFGEVRLQRR